MAVAPATPSAICRPIRPRPHPSIGWANRCSTAVAEIGDVAQFSILTLVWIFRRRPRWSVLVPIFYAIGVKSVSVVAITGTFIGMVLAVQAYHQFAMMGLATRLGSVINISIVQELGPVLAATMLAGRVGSAMAAELGTMRVTEQIDALSALGHEPDLLPGRAAVPGLPAADPALDLDGRLHGRDRRVPSVSDPDPEDRLVRLLEALARLRRQPRHLRRRVQELLLRRGDRADQLPSRFQLAAGAEGVGQAATEAFVYSFIAILFLDFVLGLGLEHRLPVDLAAGPGLL